ncbi:hypothetical protein Taro_002555, partial [Colocasia esculenta]|nr:hypothetical protein [Colocasia esculenta]
SSRESPTCLTHPARAKGTTCSAASAHGRHVPRPCKDLRRRINWPVSGVSDLSFSPLPFFPLSCPSRSTGKRVEREEEPGGYRRGMLGGRGRGAAMGISKILLFFIVFSLVLAGIRADAGVVDADDGVVEDRVEQEVPEYAAPLKVELEQLRLKISALESSIAEGNRLLKAKDETILQFENVVKEKAEKIASLHAEIELLQKKGAVDAEELVGKAHARSADLEKQVENLKSDIQAQKRKRDALEARAIEAEIKVEQLNAKLENVGAQNSISSLFLLLDILQQTSDEQKRRIKKTERALKVAEEELMKVRLEASSKKKELTEMHGAWLPPWLAIHLDQCQATAATHWNKHGKPACDAFVQKVTEILAQAHKKVEPHLVTAKKTWMPALERQWTTIRTSVEPYAKSVATKAVDVYEVSVITLKPHLVRVQEAADPYLQNAKKFSKPYIDQVATITKPHAEKVRVVLKPYTKKIVHVYGRFLKSATTYHRQIQVSAKEVLEKHELTKQLATKEFVWFAASAFLALPIFFVFQLLASIFRKKPRKSSQGTHSNHAPRRHKRRHGDK